MHTHNPERDCSLWWPVRGKCRTCYRDWGFTDQRDYCRNPAAGEHGGKRLCQNHLDKTLRVEAHQREWHAQQIRVWGVCPGCAACVTRSLLPPMIGASEPDKQ